MGPWGLRKGPEDGDPGQGELGRQGSGAGPESRLFQATMGWNLVKLRVI